jgi:MoaA/NifB/PqqE/SkfB family radical SAM enzyme
MELMEYRQTNPYCIQVELTEGCNLRCPFCGLNGIRGKDNNFKCMTVDMAVEIATGIAAADGWNPRIEFAMHGEPTMNKDAERIVAEFRHALPKAYLLMESNGGGIVGNPVTKIQDLFRAGLNCLALDQYEGINLVPKIKRTLEDALHVEELGRVKHAGPDKIQIYFYPSGGPAGNPHQRQKQRRLVFVEPISVATKGTHSTLSNHAGSGGPPNERGQGKRCAKPFRELSVRYDGSVAICCNDWRGEYVIGRVPDMNLEEIWHHPRMYAARNKLYHGLRDFGPCKGCDAVSYRPGLLPDHKGKCELEEPTKADLKLISQALADGPLTEPVKRPWELTDETSD